MFRDRKDAGDRLAQALLDLTGEAPVVLGLARGGVPVAARVAHALRAPLDAIVVRKMGHPAQPELAIGAVGPGGRRVLNEDIVGRAGLTAADVEAIAQRADHERVAREQKLRGGRPAIPLAGRTVVLVDDGIATGATLRAAARAVRAAGPRRLVLAVPVAAPAALEDLREEADETVCLETPQDFAAVGQFYEDFSATTDDEAARLLAEAPTARSQERSTVVCSDGARLATVRNRPARAKGLVLVLRAKPHAPGTGERALSWSLLDHGFATLQLDVLTPPEAQAHPVQAPAPAVLARRVHEVLDQAADADADLPLGLLCEDAAVAPGLHAAAGLPGLRAVVTCGGRPDAAREAMARIEAPSLFIVGDLAPEVREATQAAMRRMKAATPRLTTVAGAGAQLREPGAMERAAVLAADWFRWHLVDKPVARQAL